LIKFWVGNGVLEGSGGRVRNGGRNGGKGRFSMRVSGFIPGQNRASGFIPGQTRVSGFMAGFSRVSGFIPGSGAQKADFHDFDVFPDGTIRKRDFRRFFWFKLDQKTFF